MPAPSQISSALNHQMVAVVNNIGTDGLYTRKEDSATIPALKAVMSETRYEADGGMGVMETWDSFDFVVRRKSFEFSGVYKAPERGDTFAYTDEFGIARTFEVNFILGEQPYVLQPHGHMLTIHMVEK